MIKYLINYLIFTSKFVINRIRSLLQMWVLPPFCSHVLLSPPSLFPSELEKLVLEFYPLRSKQRLELFGENIFKEHGQLSRLLFYDEYSYYFWFLSFFSPKAMTTQPGLDIISLSQLSFAMLLSRKQFTERVPLTSRLGRENTQPKEWWPALILMKS